eukprot:15450832-Alexandrium_andersonii.AAC.1
MGHPLAEAVDGADRLSHRSPPSCTILAAGFSCTSASVYNVNRDDFATCIRECKGATGRTLGGVL